MTITSDGDNCWPSGSASNDDCIVTTGQCKPNVDCTGASGNGYCVKNISSTGLSCFYPSKTTVCRPKDANNVCDKHETCSGSQFACDQNGAVGSGSVKCRNHTGECDEDAYCDGTLTCPANPRKANGAACGNTAQGCCDLDDYCSDPTSNSWTSACIDAKQPNTHVCLQYRDFTQGCDGWAEVTCNGDVDCPQQPCGTCNSP